MRVPSALARASFPGPVLDVLRRLGAEGHRSWLVGGAVRDLLLRRRRGGNDFDVATPATPQVVMRLFPKVIPTGVEHGTVTVVTGGEHVEVTTFRGEGAYVDGRRPESVTFLSELEADLARRDFTMNALAYDPLARELRDPFDGRRDLRVRLVRAVGDPVARFTEDGLRPLRAVRFAAQLGFRLHAGTRAAIPEALPVVRKVSRERVADELEKLVTAPLPLRALDVMRATGLLEAVLPELAALPAGVVHHAFRLVERSPPETALRFAALLHAIAPEDVERLLLGLRLPRRVAEEAAALVRAHACPLAATGAALPASPVEVRRWLARAGPGRSGALLALALAEARLVSPRLRARAVTKLKKTASIVGAVVAEAPPLSTADLVLDGRAVMALLDAGPGPHVGEALRHLLERVLEDPAVNERSRLEMELRSWWAARSARL